MNRNHFHKLIQAVQTGGLVYATHKVRLYVKRRLKKERKFSWDDYAFEELPEPECAREGFDNKYNVSVVIPTYNGGMQLKTMLELLRAQMNCGKVEIVVVDSGSTDGTVELCQEYNVSLVQIPNEQFSHSYARNLGAETAQGSILVFMTQDALPSSEQWLSEMIAPILKNEADAVSCGEECPEGTDLYYRILNYGHASFTGMLHGDVTGSKEKCRDRISLRKYASLSDVACAIKRSVFLRFRHRYDFAEDLDLGIRLLSCGYRTKLLSGTKVIHGHNRDADYYLKRAAVEQEAFAKIFPEKAENEKPEVIASGIYYSTGVVSEYLARLETMKLGQEVSVDAFVKQASDSFDEVIKETGKHPTVRPIMCCRATLLEEIVQLCEENHKLGNYPSNTDLAYSVRFYLDNMAEYFANHVETMEGISAKDICQCMLKQFSLCTGAELMKLKKEKKWNRRILELIKGV